jgi:predicted phosphodiesterase
MTQILVIPDPHDDPEENKDRFEWAGRLVVERQPDYIVCLGDWAEMGSLCRYDIGMVTAEGRRYCDDIASTHKSLALFNKPIVDYNNKRTYWKKKKYTPKMVMCIGNHENRINTAAAQTPSLYGTITMDDLKFEEHGWDVYPITKPAIIENMAFAHYFTSGVMGRPISGVNHSRSLLIKNFRSSVVGHSHMRGMSEERTINGDRILGLVCGCYFDYQMDWTTENDRYWRGMVYLNDVVDGNCEPEFLSLEHHIKLKYS